MESVDVSSILTLHSELIVEQEKEIEDKLKDSSGSTNSNERKIMKVRTKHGSVHLSV